MYIYIEFKDGTHERDERAIADEVAELLRNANYDSVREVTVMTPLDMACYYEDD